MNKPLKVTLGLLATALATLTLALPWYSSRQVDALIQAGAAQPDDARWALRHVSHQAGLFSSSGSADVQLRSACAQDTAQEPMALHLTYQISHIPSHRGVNQFTWTLAPVGKASRLSAALNGSGAVGYSGAVSTDMDVPELRSSGNWQAVRIAPSNGRLRIDGKALTLQWNVDAIQWKTGGSSLDLQGTHLHMDLDDLQGLTGSVELGVDAAQAASTSLQGLKVRNEVREVAQRLNYKQSITAQRVNWMDKALHDVTIEGAMTGLHAKSVQTLVDLWSDSCGATALNADQSALLRQAVRMLLTSGFSVGIPTLKAHDADASVTGSLQLSLRPAAKGEPALAEQLESSGELVVQGAMLTPEQVQMVLQSGYAQEVAGGLKVGYRYADGALTVSGQPRDASLVPLVLTRFDQALNEALSPRRRNPVVVIEEGAPAP
ncbi:MAG: DUF945 family protein [Rhodoferax sp.]